MATVETTVDTDKRFAFGRNWRQFLDVVNDERIAVAEASLRAMLEVETLAGASFLDVGSGSGLFSLAAARLGAVRIHSFDYDADGVACTQELKRRYKRGMDAWTIERGSVLDPAYLASLGRFDVVYSWGVLHHTGAMWRALEGVAPLVEPGGRLFLAIYNDQGWISKAWTRVKRLYISGRPGRMLVTAVFVPYFAGLNLASDLRHLRNPLAHYRNYKQQRGMSVVHDWWDWLGGYPFEVATPGEVVRFYEARRFSLVKLKTCGNSLGCNEFVFRSTSSAFAGEPKRVEKRVQPLR
ncbi:MAG TPA: class I SAM-dependent methyltransferase [Terriglobia bacterium]|jgi:2-polyprenyl-3-methyl-5-hydroxy-6-metoxy-1,4-benzoquinol methylase|nr:class I SAM-dependent methyltransferase [Terriglobia bacterium]